MTRPPLPIPLRGPLTPEQEAWLHPKRHRFAEITRPHVDDPSVQLLPTGDPNVVIAVVTQ